MPSRVSDPSRSGERFTTAPAGQPLGHAVRIHSLLWALFVGPKGGLISGTLLYQAIT